MPLPLPSTVLFGLLCASTPPALECSFSPPATPMPIPKSSGCPDSAYASLPHCACSSVRSTPIPASDSWKASGVLRSNSSQLPDFVDCCRPCRTKRARMQSNANAEPAPSERQHNHREPHRKTTLHRTTPLCTRSRALCSATGCSHTDKPTGARCQAQFPSGRRCQQRPAPALLDDFLEARYASGPPWLRTSCSRFVRSVSFASVSRRSSSASAVSAVVIGPVGGRTARQAVEEGAQALLHGRSILAVRGPCLRAIPSGTSLA